MRTISVVQSLSLDGVMQAPGRPDEDTRGGFAHGGWALPYSDEALSREMRSSMPGTDAILIGRETYEGLYAFWPHQRDNPFADMLNKTQKYVVSTTMAEPLPWANSTVINSDMPAAVRRLKEQPGGDIVVLGSAELTQALHRHGLVDEYLLLIHPIVLGGGRRLFAEDGELSKLRLVGSVPTGTGVIIATYRTEVSP